MTEQEFLDLLKERGALQEGHFILASGLHSGQYVEKFRLLEDPRATERAVKALAEQVARYDVDVVVGPVTGGVILAYEMARQLGTEGYFTEKADNGGMVLRRGFQVAGRRVLLVEDIVSTGSSVLKAAEAVKAAGGEVVAYAILVDRSSGRFQPSEPLHALVTLEIKAYPPHEIPEELKQIPIQEPGSKHVR